jgi:DNA primase
MPTLDQVYRKFGEAAEAAQLLETEFGNMLLAARCIDEGLIESKNPSRAADILDSVNRQTLGQLLKALNNQTQSLDALDNLLSKALQERNRLFHSFYRKHNFRRNSEEGRILMLQDLEAIHSALLDAYKTVLKLSGVDLDAVAGIELPTRHLPI